MGVRGETRRVLVNKMAKKGLRMKSRGSQMSPKIVTIIIFSTTKTSTLLSKTSTKNLHRWTTKWECHLSISTIHMESILSYSNKQWLNKISTYQWCLTSSQEVLFHNSNSLRTSSLTNSINRTSSITLRISTTSLSSKPTATLYQ